MQGNNESFHFFVALFQSRRINNFIKSLIFMKEQNKKNSEKLMNVMNERG